jgi:internalin A
MWSACNTAPWGRERERRDAERTLQNTFHFHIEERGNFSSVREVSPDGLDASNLTQATSYFGKIPPVTELDLSYCPALTNVDGLNGLAALTNLDLSGCTALANVDGLKSITALKSLKLNHCDVLADVDALKGLAALTSLDLNGCTALWTV